MNAGLPPEDDGLGNAIGLEWLELESDRARGRVAVTERITQPYGLVHGGAYSVIAESLCSEATARAVAAGTAAFGQSNQSTFLRPITSGHVNALATPRHRGRTTWIWDCELTDDDGRLCALVRMTVAIRDSGS